MIQLVNKKVVPYNESEQHMKRQQDIDAILVLSKLTEMGSVLSTEVKKKAENKISTLIDKI